MSKICHFDGYLLRTLKEEKAFSIIYVFLPLDSFAIVNNSKRDLVRNGSTIWSTQYMEHINGAPILMSDAGHVEVPR